MNNIIWFLIAGILVGSVWKSLTIDEYVFATSQEEFKLNKGMGCNCEPPSPGAKKIWKGEGAGGVCTVTNGGTNYGKPIAGYNKTRTKWQTLDVPPNSCCSTSSENKPKFKGKKINKSC